MDITETYTRSGNVWLFADGTTLPVVAGGDGPVEDENTELADLLASLTAEGISGLSDDDLTNAETTLAAAIDDIDPATVTADQLQTLTAIDTAVTAVRAEGDTRTTAAAERATTAAELLARIRPPEVTDEGEGDQPTEDENTDAPAETPAEPAPAPAPETQVVVNAETPAPVVEQVPVPIAAAGLQHTTPVTSIRPVPQPANLGRAQRRAGAQHRPAAKAVSPFSITASADVAGFAGGQNITVDQLDTAIAEKFGAFGEFPANAPGPKYRVATIRHSIDEARRLSDSDGPGNEEKVRQLDAVTAGGLTASGGPCAAPMVDYSQNPIGSAERVLPGALTHVQGTRGAVSYMQPPVIGEFASGISVWTQATDTTPGGATKPCVSITCGSYVTAKTEAIVVCATIGNWIDRNYPERVAAMRTLLNVQASRFTESRHLTAIGAGSMKIPKTAVLGAARDVLTRIDLLLAQSRDQYRMADTDAITILAPRWLRNMIRADLTRELPGSQSERLATADAQINSFFAVRGVTVDWLMDGESGAAFPAAVDNVATRWPLLASIYAFPTGSWKFLDDGVLNLSVSGPYHDSVLNATNNAQLWWETFENVYFQGTWSRRLDINVCPTGSTSATTAVVCNTGS